MDGGNAGAAQTSPKKGTTVEQFLTPEAMLTPGVAGTAIFGITTALEQNLGFPGPLTGLGLSFMVGLLVLVADKRWWERAIYYVLNSLMIFSFAVGLSNWARTPAGTARAPQPAQARPLIGSSHLLIAQAVADDNLSTPPSSPPQPPTPAAPNSAPVPGSGAPSAPSADAPPASAPAPDASSPTPDPSNPPSLNAGNGTPSVETPRAAASADRPWQFTGPCGLVTNPFGKGC